MTARLAPGTASEVGYVTRDLEKTLDFWTGSVRAGPFFKMTYPAGIVTDYRGTPSNGTMTAALAFSGLTLIEIIQPAFDGPSIFTEFLEAFGEGYHHYYPNIRPLPGDEFDRLCAHYLARGHMIAARTTDPMFGRNIFFDANDGSHTYIEMLEFSTPASYASVERLYEEHIAWDGSRPVRDFAELFE